MAPRLIALIVLALSVLPVANMLPGGESDPDYAARLLDWLNGLALCAGVGVLAAFMARRRGAPLLGKERIATNSEAASGIEPGLSARDDTPRRGDNTFLTILVAGSFVVYALIAQYVYAGRPLHIDEIVQAIQARWYAGGGLSVALPAAGEFFSVLHMVDIGERVYSQFPAGGPAMLALGSLFGAEWLVGPVCGAASVGLFWALLPALEPEGSLRWRRGAAVLFALAPFGAFMFGSHMNHATSLMWILIAVVSLVRATSPSASPWWGLLVGSALGAAATIRPVDAVAFALPAAVWLLWRTRSGGRPVLTLLLSGLGVALPIAALMWVNARTTGSPLLFGYEVLWGSDHSLGFHQPPWGPAHTPARGFELVSLYLTRLSVYLLETPYPALLLVAGALWLTPKLRPVDKYLLWSSALLLIGYWAYWHDGFFRGPRFVFALTPVLIAWTARFPLHAAELAGRGSATWVGIRAALAASVVMATITLVAVRIPTYRNDMTSSRFAVERESARAGVRDALVLVKESWGSRLVARMWALGISRPETERLYRKTDACLLELAITDLERLGTDPAGALDRLRPLLVDSARVIPSTRSPESSEGMLPGLVYAPICEAEVSSDWAGSWHLAPFLAAKDGNVYARWLPGREGEISAAYPGRPVYRLSRSGPEVTAAAIWEPLPVIPAP
ncbi:MAG: hypothetical protein ACYC0B_02560 [Gemmatimonadaceae bacterium]